jgi:hypothetical protein
MCHSLDCLSTKCCIADSFSHKCRLLSVIVLECHSAKSRLFDVIRLIVMAPPVHRVDENDMR